MKEKEELSLTQQDYIKAIWNLEQVGIQAKVSVVADQLSVKPPTVLAMYRQLLRLGLIIYDKRIGANLTNRGRDEAQQLIRKHRLIETFLNQVLNVEEPLLHNEAEKLEHVISDQLIMKIDEYLNYPRTDPHGAIIPLYRTDDLQYLLKEIEEDIPFKILQVPMSGKEKNYCSENDFLPGSRWHIKKISPRGESFLVTDGTNYLAISDHLAEKIRVAVIRNQ
jgi:Mn-dependent DtxR family transcriptional regulator